MRKVATNVNYYIYKFKHKDNIIYVGKTIDINKRMYTHFTKGHLPLECYDQVDTIQYIECKNNTDMNIKELYFINKYKPIYNTVNKSENDEIVIQEFEGIEWNNEYQFNAKNDKINSIKEYYDSIIIDLKSQISELKESNKKCLKKQVEVLTNSSRCEYLANSYKDLLTSITIDNINTIGAEIRSIENNKYWTNENNKRKL